MSSDWSFDDDLPLALPSESDMPRCYHCGTVAPQGIPSSNARCATCGYHLHTCPNCILYDGLGCLILSPFIWREGGVMGQDCPSFIWRTAAAMRDLGFPESLEG